jgi:hypothetical protein
LDAIDCCSHTPAPGLVVNGDEQTMRPGVTVIVEPRLALGRGERMEIERDRRIDDVMIVDIGQRLEVVERCRSNRIVGHGELYAGLSMRKSSRANHQALRGPPKLAPHSPIASGSNISPANIFCRSADTS